jgi:noranthrone monooxygenase
LNIYSFNNNDYSRHHQTEIMPVANPSNVGVEAIAVITGAFLSGAMMNLFLLTIPMMLETTNQPVQLLHQWSCVFYSGHHKGPGISIATGLIYSYAAWSNHAAGIPWRVFALAGALTVGMVPFTWVFMMGTNNALFKAEAKSKSGGDRSSWKEVESLVKTWSGLNAIRALFPLSGAVLGMLATCKLVLF